MKFRSENSSMHEGSIKYALQDTEDIIRETIPVMVSYTNINEKYFLFIKSRLYLPCSKNSIKSIESLITIDDIAKTKIDEVETVEPRITQLTNSKVRTPYPNKRLYLNSMKYDGRRLCNDGFVLMFDTFKELQAIDTITIDWKVNLEESDGKTLDLNKKIICHPYFIKNEQNTVFSIMSHDMFLGAMDSNDVEEYISQFDGLCPHTRDFSHERFGRLNVLFSMRKVTNLIL